MRIALLVCSVLTCASLALAGRPASAEWQPPGLHPTAQTLAGVLAAHAKAEGTPNAAFAQRREHWTYTSGTHVLPVNVAVRGEDYRATIAVGSSSYQDGRLHGTRWRGDANGIVHGYFADQQGDALDRLPQSLFPLLPGTAAVAGETGGSDPAWVVADRSAGEPTTWIFVRQATGLIEREMTREGRRIVTIGFDRFAATGGLVRPQHWHVTDGNPLDELDVVADTVVPGPVPADAVALPSVENVFAPRAGAPGTIALPAHFHGAEVLVDVDVDGRHREFILDSGTASITLDAREAGRFDPVLEHATVPRMAVGPLELGNVSVFTTPIFSGSLQGILGYDFFFGHVVRIDYLNKRVEVLSHEAAASIFADPKTAVLPANVDHGLPLVHAAFGPAAGNAFAVDTGSDRLYVFAPFLERNAAEVAAHWTPVGRPHLAEYLEGSVEVSERTASSFALGPFRIKNVRVGAQVPSTAADALTIPFDGIIGTDVLKTFDVYFDYDNSRIGLRR